MSNRPRRSGRRPQHAKTAPRAGRVATGKDAEGVFWFEHPVGSGQRHPLPRPKFGPLRKAAKQGGEMEQITYLIEQTAGPDTLDVLDDMEVADVEAVFDAWRRALGGSLGDTSPSSGS